MGASHTLPVCFCGKIAYPSEGWAKLGIMHWSDIKLEAYRAHGSWHLRTKNRQRSPEYRRRKKERYNQTEAGKARTKQSLAKLKARTAYKKRLSHLMAVKTVIEALIEKKISR